MEVGPKPLAAKKRRWVGTLASLGGWLGLLLLLAGLGVGLFHRWKSVWTVALLGIGVLGVALALVSNWQRIRRAVFSRRGLAALSVALQIVFVLGLLVMASFANTRYYKRFDLTSKKNFALSSHTKNLLSGLEKPVAITPFFPLRSMPDSDMAALWPRVKDLLEEYKLQSDKIEVENNVDPYVERENIQFLAQRLKVKLPELAVGSVVFHSGDKSKHVAFQGLLEREPFSGYGQPPPPKFRGEEAFTGAIISVTEETQTTVYFLSGHGEPSIDDDLSTVVGSLKRDNYRVQELSLAKGTGVPDDCDVLVIVGPTRELPGGELAEIESWVGEGGRLIVLFEALKPQEGLIDMVSAWGIEVGADIVIEQGNYNLSPTRPQVNHYPPHQITQPLEGVNTVFALARSVSRHLEGPGEYARVQPLVETTSESWAETGLDDLTAVTFDEDIDKKGPVSLGVVSELSAGPYPMAPAPTSGGRVIAFGDADFVSNKFLVHPLFGVTVSGNIDLFTNCVKWLAGKESDLGISPKTLQQEMLIVSSRARQVVFWLTVVALPLLVLIAGGVMWFWRKRI